MGIQPKIWGPAAWFFFHSVMHNYPIDPSENNITEYKQFLTSFANVLPCPTCKDDFTSLVNEYIVDDSYFTTKNQMVYLGYLLHDRVNEKIGNKYDITPDKVLETYKLYESDPKNAQYEMEYQIEKIESDNHIFSNKWMILMLLIIACYVSYRF